MTKVENKVVAAPTLADQMNAIIALSDASNSKRSKVLKLWKLKQDNVELADLSMYKIAQLLGYTPQMVRNYIVGSSGAVKVLTDDEKKAFINNLLAK